MKVRKGVIAFLALAASMTAITAVDANAQMNGARVNYVIANGMDITIISAARSSDAEELAAHCGYNTDDYIIQTTDRGEYTAVELFEAREYSVIADGNTVSGRATGGTVGELLEELDITLGEEDLLSAPMDYELTDGMEIRIFRITYGEDTAQEPIPHTTEYTESDELFKGEEKTVSEGVDGVKRLTYKVKYMDGQEIGRELVDEETVTEPTPTVVALGTREKPKPPEPKKTTTTPAASSPKSAPSPESSSENDGAEAAPAKGDSSGAEPSKNSTSDSNIKTSNTTVTAGDGVLTTSEGTEYTYSKTLTMKATAYSYSAGSMTSSGKPVQVGIVAALPSTLPPGTRVYIVTNDGKYTYGPAVVGDTPGSDIIDLFFETEAECYQFGVRQATVYVLS